MKKYFLLTFAFTFSFLILFSNFYTTFALENTKNLHNTFFVSGENLLKINENEASYIVKTFKLNKNEQEIFEKVVSKKKIWLNRALVNFFKKNYSSENYALKTNIRETNKKEIVFEAIIYAFDDTDGGTRYELLYKKDAKNFYRLISGKKVLSQRSDTPFSQELLEKEEEVKK